VTTSLAIGALAASSLVLGGLLALWRRWHTGTVGLVLAFGAGALIASVAFELAEEGVRVGGAVPVGVGLAAGALTFFLADRWVMRWGAANGGTGSAGLPLALGALLDGIPEQLVLGIGLAYGGEASVALLVAIFLSNLPEAIGASADLRDAGRPRLFVVVLWVAVAVPPRSSVTVRVTG
jgi:ZIP family zinc transporter